MRFKTPIAVLSTAVLAGGLFSVTASAASANPDWGNPPNSAPAVEWILENGAWKVCTELPGYKVPAKECKASKVAPPRVIVPPRPTRFPTLPPHPPTLPPHPTHWPTVKPTIRPTFHLPSYCPKRGPIPPHLVKACTPKNHN